MSDPKDTIHPGNIVGPEYEHKVKHVTYEDLIGNDRPHPLVEHLKKRAEDEKQKEK